MGNRKSAPRQRKPASRSQKGFGRAQGPLVARRRKGDGGGHQRRLEAVAQDVDQAPRKKPPAIDRTSRFFSTASSSADGRRFANITGGRVRRPRVPFWKIHILRGVGP